MLELIKIDDRKRTPDKFLSILHDKRFDSSDKDTKMVIIEGVRKRS